MKFLQYCLLVSLVSLSPVLLAAHPTIEAPVVDVDQDAENTEVESTGAQWESMNGLPTDNTDTAKKAEVDDADDTPAVANESPLSVPRMSQQIRNITAMNMPQQISDLRQKVATLQGQLEVTERDLKIISAQQARFYEDLSHQIVALKSGSPSKPPQSPLSKNKAHLQQALNDATTYQNAFKLLAQKNNAGAEKAFNQYLKQYPKGKFIANAHYWLGEIAYNNKQFDQSFAQFQTVVTKYPKSVKVAESKLKIAEIHAKKGKVTLAKIELKQIERDYAHSTTAQIAQHQLKQLK